MPKHWFKKHLPHPSKTLHQSGLGTLAHWFHHPNLWHCNRHCIANACFIGLFVAMLPIPMQMLVAALVCVVFHANIPVALMLVWVSNPLTMLPLFYTAYKIGSALIQVEPIDFDMAFITEWRFWEWPWKMIAENLLSIWAPLLLGSLWMGTTLGLVAYYTTHYLWRRSTLNRWYARKRRKPSTRHSLRQHQT